MIVVIVFALTGVAVAQEETLATSSSKMLFILGTDENEGALLSAKNNSTLTGVMDIDVYTQNDTIPAINFSQYCVVVIENRTSADIAAWSAGLDAAKANGTHIIGYMLPHDVSITSVNQTIYTTFERYWIQGGQDNINNLIMYLGKQLCGKWASTTIPEPQVVRQRVSITYILNSDACNYYLNRVLSSNRVITDRFNVHVYSGSEAVSGLHDISHEDVIFLYMIGANEMTQLKDALLAAKANGTQIGLFGMMDTYGVATLDLTTPPHSIVLDYFNNTSEANMEGWIRYAGSEIAGAYIQYPPPAPASIPSYGIYHPDAFPRIFANSTEYLEWYGSAGSHHLYDPNNITVGIILPSKLGKTQIEYTLENAIIRELESRGCNVIPATYDMFSSDRQYFVDVNGTVLVDVIVSLKGFYMNYFNQAAGVAKLQSFNVPVIKAIGDYYQSPDEYNNSTHGLSTSSLYYQVVQPEIDGCIEYIWVGGRVKNAQGQYYYEPLPQHVEWLCNRTIRWAHLHRMSNAQKKVVIMYYNHEGGKNNIGASYLDTAKSISLVLQRMRAEGYDLGNGTLPNGTELIDLFIESRNVGTWAPGELQKLVQSGYVELIPKDEYMQWYNTLPADVRADVEAKWGPPPGDVMVYGDSIVIPRLKFGNIVVMPQPMRAKASDEKLLYHSKEIPPTHQYLAAYFWISRDMGADAIVHFGTHGTQEWLPGSEVSLHRYDYPSIMVDDIPVVYPYIMDNVGEGTQAKRRGNAVIIDHLTPPIVTGDLYGELLELNDKIEAYEKATDSSLKQSYRDAILDLYESLHLDEDLNVSKAELELMNDTQFTSFLDNELTDYIDEIRWGYMPYGLHVFGVPPEGSELVSMVKSMLGKPFIDHIVAVIPHTNGTQREWESISHEYAERMLEHVLLNGTNVTYAQMEVLGLVNATISDDLNTSLVYASRLNQTTREIDQLMRALNAEYIEPASGNDPIRNPDALPTGRNFYSFDPRKFPDEQTEAMGALLADQLLSQHLQATGSYPKKVAFVLWSVETMRHRGLVEAEIYSLLGVKLKRSWGRVVGFEVIPQSQLGRPRIDVVLVPSGLYRDTFSYQLQLMDEAIRLVANLNESNSTNYVRANSLALYQQLVDAGYNNTTAWDLAQCRIFSEAPGDYGTGLPEAIAASNTWDNESKLADLFLSRMCNVYGKTRWGESYEDVLRMNMEDVEAAVHSDSSNLYGLIDNDDFFQYLGGIILAVRSLTGSNPESYVADLRNPTSPQMTTLEHMFRTELRTRYLNPKWIQGMMEFDYAGAREMQKLVEFMWGWDVTDPTLVTDANWQQLYEVYVQDKYGLGVDEFLKSNPYAQQSITARMLEAIRKGYWDASDDVKAALAEEYVRSVAQSGVACCHHTCGNPSLDAYVQGLMSLPGMRVDLYTYQQYLQQLQDATLRPQQMPQRMMQSTDSGAWRVNETQHISGEVPGVSDEPSTAEKDTQEAEEVSGYELTQERQKVPALPPITSSVPIMGLVFVLIIGGTFGIGYLLRGRGGL
ncbi:MAG: cobaltochelatase CobN [Methanosarcinales archaeon]|nr:cobaltochelatase CobN [Methanosarcinales archaeon]